MIAPNNLFSTEARVILLKCKSHPIISFFIPLQKAPISPRAKARVLPTALRALHDLLVVLPLILFHVAPGTHQVHTCLRAFASTSKALIQVPLGSLITFKPQLKPHLLKKANPDYPV